MTDLVFLPSNAVQTVGSQLFTTSPLVAEIFEKRHAHVLRDIDSLDCSPEFHSSNFGLMVREIDPSNGVHGSAASRFGLSEKRFFEITKDGFTFLVMGYTGAKAASFKEAYIRRFNDMDAALRQRDNPDLTALRAELAALERRLTGNPKPSAGERRQRQHDRVRDRVAAYLARRALMFANVDRLGRDVLHKTDLTPAEREAIAAGLRQMGYAYSAPHDGWRDRRADAP
jgi:Rha family phage regulatory protein